MNPEVLNDPMVRSGMWVVATVLPAVAAIYLARLCGLTLASVKAKRTTSLVLSALFVGLLWLVAAGGTLMSWYYTHKQLNWFPGESWLWLFICIWGVANASVYTSGRLRQKSKS